MKTIEAADDSGECVVHTPGFKVAIEITDFEHDAPYEPPCSASVLFSPAEARAIAAAILQAADDAEQAAKYKAMRGDRG